MTLADWSLSDPATWQWINTEQVLATTGVITLLLLAAAGIAAWVQVAHARDSRKEQYRPFVIDDVLAAKAQLFRIEVKNVGRTIARDVKLVFDPSIASTLDRENRRIRNIPILKQGIPSVAPGRSHRFLLDKASARSNSDLPDHYDVTVTYTAHDGTSYEELL